MSEKTKLSTNWALALVLLAIIGLAALGAWLLVPRIQEQFGELAEQLPVVYQQAREKLAQHRFGRWIVAQIPDSQQLVFGNQSGNIFGRITGLFSSVFNAATNILIVLMTAVYFAFSLQSYKEGIIKLVPRSREKRAREILYVIYYTLKNFLLGISVSMTINGMLTFLGLWLLDIPFAIPLGIIAGLMSFVPNIGPLVAGVPAVIIALAQSPAQALYVLILYVAVQNLDGFIVTPLIQKRAVSIPPVLIITSQLLLAVLFGFLGILLAVPLVAAVSVLVKMIDVEDIFGRKVESQRRSRGEREVLNGI